jgi:hypothetical protein
MCPVNSFADRTGLEVCTPCGDIGGNLLTVGTGSDRAGLCVCGPGFYSLREVTRAAKQPCLACDQGTMACDNTTIST